VLNIADMLCCDILVSLFRRGQLKYRNALQELYKSSSMKASVISAVKLCGQCLLVTVYFSLTHIVPLSQ